MSPPDHLTLRELHLKNGGKWGKPRSGLHFVFPIAGSGAYVSGGLSRPIERGDVLIVNQTADWKLCASEGNECLFREFSLCIEHLFPLLTAREIPLAQPLARHFGTFKIYPATSPRAIQCQRLIAEVTTELNLAHRAQLLCVAAAILNNEFQVLRQNCEPRNQLEKHMADLFQQLTADQLLAFSVGELAARFHCSRRHLNRVFHQYFKMSVAALKMEMRLLKATSLLRDLNAKVIDIAAECGFNHLGLFNACFRKRFGTTPSEWRRNSSQTLSQRRERSPADPSPSSVARQRDSAGSNAAPLDPSTPEQLLLLARIKNAIHRQAVPPESAAGSPKPITVVPAPKSNSQGLSFQICDLT